MNKSSIVIFHIDVDSFFVAAEVSLRPELKNKDIAISHNRSSSIVTSLSYSAKQKGARVPMKLFDVKKICPNLINLKPNYSLYETLSKRIFNFIKKNYSLKIEVGSIDEWYIDVSKYVKIYNSPIVLAKKIQNDILSKFNVSVSIGISYNKFLAKMATDLNKPCGITLIRKKDIKEKIWPLKINLFVGIGVSLANQLMEEHILTIGDLAKIDKNNSKFIKIFKNKIDYYIDNANGIGDNKINIANDIKETSSIGSQHSFEKKEESDILEISLLMKKLCKRISYDLTKKNLIAQNIHVSIKYVNKKNFSFSKKILIPTNDFMDIYNHALKLFLKMWTEKEIKVLSVSVSLLKSTYNEDRYSSLLECKNKNENNNVINIINKINSKMKFNNLKLLSDKK